MFRQHSYLPLLAEKCTWSCQGTHFPVCLNSHSCLSASIILTRALHLCHPPRFEINPSEGLVQSRGHWNIPLDPQDGATYPCLSGGWFSLQQAILWQKHGWPWTWGRTSIPSCIKRQRLYGSICLSVCWPVPRSDLECVYSTLSSAPLSSTKMWSTGAGRALWRRERFRRVQRFQLNSILNNSPLSPKGNYYLFLGKCTSIHPCLLDLLHVWSQEEAGSSLPVLLTFIAPETQTTVFIWDLWAAQTQKYIFFEIINLLLFIKFNTFSR